MKRIFYLFLFLFLATNASAQIDFSNSILSDPVGKKRIDSIINNSDYVFEGKVIDIKRHIRETGKEEKRSYLFQIESIYKGNKKIKGGTIELIIQYPTWGPQDTMPASFLTNNSYILFCKNTPIKGIYNASNETKLELFYSFNYIFSFFKELPCKSYDSNNNAINIHYYYGFGALRFQNKENLNAFLQSYALTPKAALQSKLLKTEVYPELLKYYPIEKKESDTIHAKARAADSIKLIQLLDSIHKIKQSKPKEEKDRFLNTLNIPDSIKRYMQVKDSIYKEKQVKKKTFRSITSPDVEFTLSTENIEKTGDESEQYVEFDIMLKASKSGAYLNSYNIILMYESFNNQPFTENISETPDFSYEIGPLFNNPSYLHMVTPMWWSAENTLTFRMFSVGSPQTEIPTTNTFLFHVKMKINPNTEESTDIVFIPLFEGEDPANGTYVGYNTTPQRDEENEIIGTPIQYVPSQIIKIPLAAQPQITDFYINTPGNKAGGAGCEDILVIKGTEFGDRLEDDFGEQFLKNSILFTLGDNTTDSTIFYRIDDEEDFLQWSDTIIKIRIPSVAFFKDLAIEQKFQNKPQYPGTGIFKVQTAKGKEIASQDSIYIQYVLANYYYKNSSQKVQKEIYTIPKKNCTNGFKFRVSQSVAADVQALGTIQKALQDWSQKVGITFELELDNNGNPLISESEYNNDGINTIFYTDKKYNGEAMNTTLMQNSYKRRTSIYEPKGYTLEFDIAINSTINNWHKSYNYPPYSKQYDFYSTFLHELGHGLGLGHTLNALSNDLMRPTIPPDLRVTLAEDNNAVSGALKIIEYSSNLPLHFYESVNDPEYALEVLHSTSNSACNNTYERLYVNAATTNTTVNGASWETAYLNLTEALNYARQNGHVKEIWIAKGKYRPAKDSSFHMINNVAMYGGFNGNETDLSQRNFGSNETVLAGNKSAVIANKYTSSNPLTNTAVIDGFIITEGIGIINTPINPNYPSGGGIYNEYASPTIQNCKIIKNGHYFIFAGGGIFNYQSSPVLKDVTIRGNLALNGGGIYNFEYSSPLLENVTLTKNTAYAFFSSTAFGGAMMNEKYCSPTLTNILIAENKAVGRDTSLGSAIYNTDNSHCILTNVTIASNQAYPYKSGCIYNEKNSFVDVKNSIISNNNIEYGSISNSTDAGVSKIQYSQIDFCGNSGYDWDYYIGMDMGGNIDEPARFVTEYNFPENFFNNILNDFFNNLGDTIDIAGDYRLQEESKCINGGYNAFNNTLTDLDGNSRITHNYIDMGCYESPYHKASRLYVDHSRTNATVQDGKSWETAFLCLSDAINYTQHNFTSVKEIWVAKGTYQLLNSISMFNNVAIYGGFNGTETNALQRNWKENETILKGTTYKGIIENFNIDTSAILDGFILTDGDVGISNDEASPRISNCKIMNIYYNGIISTYSSPIITNCEISNTLNGIFNRNASPTFSNCKITENVEAIYNYASSPLFTNCVIANNINSYSSGAITNSVSSPTLINVLIANNKGTGIYAGGITNNSSSHCTLINVTIINNESSSGSGGIYNMMNSSTEIKNSIIYGNSCTNTAYIDFYNDNNASQSTYENSLIGSKNNTNLINLGGNIDGNPFLTTNYQLSSNSPCVNAGNNSFNTTPTDLAGNERIQASTIDMGCYESLHSPFPKSNKQKEDYATEEVKIYPNPVSINDVTTIEINTSGIPFETAKIEIFTIMGSKVSEHVVSENRTNMLTPKTPGHYIVKVTLNNKVIKVSKLIVV